jgi:hypothetical protein
MGDLFEGYTTDSFFSVTAFLSMRPFAIYNSSNRCRRAARRINNHHKHDHRQ